MKWVYFFQNANNFYFKLLFIDSKFYSTGNLYDLYICTGILYRIIYVCIVFSVLNWLSNLEFRRRCSSCPNWVGGRGNSGKKENIFFTWKSSLSDWNAKKCTKERIDIWKQVEGNNRLSKILLHFRPAPLTPFTPHSYFSINEYRGKEEPDLTFLYFSPCPF